jgi:hypothetical protein
MAATGVCVPFRKIVDQVQDAASKNDAEAVAKVTESFTRGV